MRLINMRLSDLKIISAFHRKMNKLKNSGIQTKLKDFGVIFLTYLATVIVFGVVLVCVIATFRSIFVLNNMLGEKLSGIKSFNVANYPPPGLLFLANGMYTYSCINSAFRLDPRPVEEDKNPNLEPEDRRLRIQDFCSEHSIDFDFSLEDLTDNQDAVDDLPNWLKKNLVSTLDLSDCSGGIFQGFGTVRKKRDYTDDRYQCDGPCSKIWKCANDPTICVQDRTFDICFSQTHFLATQEPCVSYRQCLGGPIKHENLCTGWIQCLHPDSLRTDPCITVYGCLKLGE